jgi:hypothetical protein
MTWLIRMTRCAALGSSIACAAAVAVAATPRGGDYAVEDALIAGGGAAQARGGCFELSATIAQATVGAASGGNYALASGFWTRPVTHPDQLLRTGFEGCAP